jgi:hypothetical protein
MPLVYIYIYIFNIVILQKFPELEGKATANVLVESLVQLMCSYIAQTWSTDTIRKISSHENSIKAKIEALGKVLHGAQQKEEMLQAICNTVFCGSPLDLSWDELAGCLTVTTPELPYCGIFYQLLFIF